LKGNRGGIGRCCDLPFLKLSLAQTAIMNALAICFISHCKSCLSGFLADFTQGKTVWFIPIQNNGFSERLKPFRWGLPGGGLPGGASQARRLFAGLEA